MHVKVCTKCRIEKSVEAFTRRKQSPDGWQPKCRACRSVYNAQYRVSNWERIKRAMVQWRAANSERKKEGDARRYRLKRDSIREQQKQYYADTRPKNKAHKSTYKAANRAAFNALDAERKARQLRATPKWSNPFFIGEVYDLAQRRKRCFGFAWHVDHVVPLKSALVCGLHVENNLQVIPGSQNCSKNNRRWPDMPC